MKILVIGGTGAMGVPLVNILAEKGNQIYVTSRSERKSIGNINYIKGNGLDSRFVREVLRKHRYDAVVDFMVRSQENLKNLLEDFLSNTSQYVFISSARVYAQSDAPITEDTPRLLDVSDDREFLSTNEYALAKAREENILFNSGKTNFTIVRPSITYNDYRLQLGVFEKEDWLKRALQGKTVVFSEDLMDKTTTMTHGDDVAAGIAALIGRRDALGQAFHITSPESLKWGEVLGIYKKTLEEALGRKVKVTLTGKSTNFIFPGKKYQLIYCRYFNRSFDNTRISKFIDVKNFKTPEEGLSECLRNFIAHPKFLCDNVILDAVHDRLTGERSIKTDYIGLKQRITYFLYRTNLQGLYKLASKVKRILK